jgi:hypothetical protein
MEDAANKTDVLVGETAAQREERRAHKRHTVSVDSQVEELRTQAVINGRITDLCLGGCYVDAMMTFPVGTEVMVHCRRDDLIFEAEARIVYAKPGLGMGLAFHEIGSAEMEFLTRWIDDLSGEAPRARRTQRVNPPDQQSTRPVSPLQRLVTMLARKGALDQSEYELLLREIGKTQKEK